jgi:hypothetical protein
VEEACTDFLLDRPGRWFRPVEIAEAEGLVFGSVKQALTRMRHRMDQGLESRTRHILIHHDEGERGSYVREALVTEYRMMP